MLSEEDNQTIFDKYIKVDLRPASINLENKKPFAIFLGGQSGSGKSSLVEYLYSQLRTLEKSTTITINSDKLREYHPDFYTLQKAQPNKASFLVNPDTVKWQQKLIDFAISIRCNLILDGTLGGNSEPIVQTMHMLRDKSYYLRVCLLAVQACESRFGIYKRYEDHIVIKGQGRWVGLQTHDNQYNDIPKTLTLLESKKLVDQIQIYKRPAGLLAPPLIYDNRLKDNQWNHPPNAEKALAEGRARPWTPEERTTFSLAVQAVAEQMRQRGVTREDIHTFYRYVEWPMLTYRKAQLADAQLYFDWANDPETRRQSFHSGSISLETHTAWFSHKLADANALLLIAENEARQPVGQIRFERTPVADMPDEIIVGVSVDARFRGQGLASEVIRLGCAVCQEEWGAVTIHAYIKPDNQGSIRSFTKAGFTFSHESGKFGIPSFVYSKTV